MALNTGSTRVDHLVVTAGSLEEGVAWCEAALGVTPGPGGRHDFMGTHNRLLAISSASFPNAYLEIIAIDPQAPAPGRPRWFDLDSPALRQHIATHGPQLTHFVARVPDVAAAARALQGLGQEPGAVRPASRMTPHGELRWQITVRDDGARLFDGMLPTLIEWGSTHPTHDMALSGISLESLQACHPANQALAAAFTAIGLGEVAIRPGEPRLVATLLTPKGRVTLG